MSLTARVVNNPKSLLSVTLSKIISGGQTGVDRGALSAALDNNFPCGGWCPQGRIAEDGVIPTQYPLIELSDRNYLPRTIKNIQASDGTVIIYFDYLEGGTEQTLFYCIAQNKPYKLIDGTEISATKSATLIVNFINKYHLEIINVAGPRLSKYPQCYDYSYQSIYQVIEQIRNN